MICTFVELFSKKDKKDGEKEKKVEGEEKKKD